MKMRQQTNRTFTDKFLEEFWTAIDISDSIKRVEDYLISAPSGLAAALIGIALFSAAIGSGYLAYVFDFKSTADGMSALTAFIIPELPESQVQMTQWLGLILTIIPTIIELFAAGLAKQQIRIMQLFVVAFTMFDLVTDIPKAMAWTNSLQPQFNQLGLLSGIGHAAFFMFWLFMSTIGFELATIILAWAAVGLFLKALGYERVSRIASAFHMTQRNNNTPKNEPKQTINMEDLLNQAKNK